jgi:hypothetical protein
VRESRNGLALAAKHRYHIGLEDFAAIEITGVPAPQFRSVVAFSFPTVRYWWVNQNQTYRKEQAGGYLWSPKRNANGAKNPFYETMREVAPGDVGFRFRRYRDCRHRRRVIVLLESPKPAEFGTRGE